MLPGIGLWFTLGATHAKNVNKRFSMGFLDRIIQQDGSWWQIKLQHVAVSYHYCNPITRFFLTPGGKPKKCVVIKPKVIIKAFVLSAPSACRNTNSAAVAWILLVSNMSYVDPSLSRSRFRFLSLVTRVPAQATPPPPGIVELDGEKFTLQWWGDLIPRTRMSLS